MPRRKYIKDYRLVETVDERGRIRTGYEYIGRHYRYVSDAAAVSRAKTLCLAACIVGALAFVGALIPLSTAMRTFYTAIPFVFSALPLGILTETMISVHAAPEPLEHSLADRLASRRPAASLITAILTGASLLGELVSLVLGVGLLSGDIIFCLCAALECACGVLVFLQKDALRTEAE